jgi:hypothetical protein
LTIALPRFEHCSIEPFPGAISCRHEVTRDIGSGHVFVADQSERTTSDVT